MVSETGAQAAQEVNRTMETHEINDDHIQALKQALDNFNRFAVDHSDNCIHRHCAEAPCMADDDCYADGDIGPCDPAVCFAAACDGVYIIASALVKSIEAVR